MKAVRNGLWNGASTLVSGVLSLVATIVVVRALSSDAYGTFSYYIWLFGVVASLGTLNFAPSLTKISSELLGQGRESSARLLGSNIVLLVACFNFLIATGVMIVGLSSGGLGEKVSWLLAATIIPTALSSVLGSVMWGRQDFRITSIVGIGGAAAQMMLVLLVWVAHGQVFGYLVALQLPIYLQLTILLTVTLKRRWLSFSSLRWEPAILKRYLTFALPATISWVFETVVWQRSEVFFLKLYSTPAQIGFYSLSYGLLITFISIGWALTNGFYAAMSHDYAASSTNAKVMSSIKTALSMSVFYGAPLTIGGIIVARPLVDTLFGSRMLPSVSIMDVLLIGLTPATVTGVLGMVLNATNGVWTSVVIGSVTCICNIGLNFWLISHIGAVGGAIANTATQVLLLVMLLGAARRRRLLDFDVKATIITVVVAILTCGLLPWAVVRCFPLSSATLGIVPICALAYFVVCVRLHLTPPMGSNVRLFRWTISL